MPWYFKEKALDLLDLPIERGVEIAMPDEIVAETIRVIHEKFRWSDERLEEAGATISSITRHVALTENSMS